MSEFVSCNRFFLSVFLALSAGSAAAADRQVLHGHVPAPARSLPSVGRLAPSTNLHLAIGLPLRDAAGLANLLRQQQDPSSPNYRQFLTPEQFAARFGATEQDYEAVVAFAQSHGLKVTARHPNRLVLSVSGASRDIERAFHLSLRLYRHPTETRTFHAPDTEPSVDLAVPILQVSGLDDFALPRPHVHSLPAHRAGGRVPRSGSSLLGYYIGNDFRTAYVPGTTLRGDGQSVGLLQFDGYYAKDITNYITDAGITTSVILTNVAIDGGVGTPGGNNIEVSLDIEMALAMAPGVSTIIVYEAPNPSPWVDLLSRMANDNLARQLSCSWGGGPPDATAEQIFQQMAAQGQSFFNASGDSDAFTSAVPFPSDSTNIVQVGGTTLTMSGSGSAYLSEMVWNPCTYDSQYDRYVGSGGGTSTCYSIPGYQQGIDMSSNQGSVSMRNIPDVAMTADHVYVRCNNGGTNAVGGTSCAAPLWAGFTALVNQQAAINAAPPVGFLNPAIYSIGKGASYTSAFHDITVGSNSCPYSPSRFFASAGYDLCTGWGTPNGTNLINALVPFNTLRITPLSGATFAGPFGGSFRPAFCSLLLTNAGVAAITWSAGTTSMWFTLDPASGTLPAGGTTNVTVTLTEVAASLAVQSHAGTMWFTNQTDGTEQIRAVSLQVEDPLRITPSAGAAFAGTAGGIFSPSSCSLVLSNAWSDALAWSAGASSTWFALVPAGGTLPSGGMTTVTVSLTATAGGLDAQTYAGTARFTNQFNAAGQDLPVLLVAQPVVQNGGFETGDTNHWAATGSYAILDADYWYSFDNGETWFPGATFAHSGTYGLMVGTPYTLGYLSQTLQTAPGRPYLLSFWLTNPWGGTPNEFCVSWGGNTLLDTNNMEQCDWTNLQFVVVASATTTVLRLGARQDPNVFGLDDISVRPLIMPVFGSFAANTNAVSIAWSASTNVHYQVEYATNLVPAQWNNLGAPVLGTGGTMTAADLLPATPQRFYRVILQP